MFDIDTSLTYQTPTKDSDEPLTMEMIEDAIAKLRKAQREVYENKAVILPYSLQDRKPALEREFPGLEVVVNSLVPDDQIYFVNKIMWEDLAGA